MIKLDNKLMGKDKLGHGLGENISVNMLMSNFYHINIEWLFLIKYGLNLLLVLYNICQLK